MIPQWAYPGSMHLLIAGLITGVLLDLIYPMHRGLLLRVHPVRISYYMAKYLIPPYSGMLRGLATSLIIVTVILVPSAIVLYMSWYLSPAAWAIVSGIILKLSASTKLLIDTVEGVRECLSSGDVHCARVMVQGIVRRDTSSLDEAHVASAAIESLSESLVDGTLSPLFWYSILGPLGALFQRIVNTLDGAVGYKTSEYIDAGRFPALLDTLVNYIPARLTAILSIILSPLAGLDYKGSYRSWIRYRSVTESRNAGNPMSAFAGALNVWLEKEGHYRIGGGRSPSWLDVGRAIRLSILVYIASIVLCMAIILFMHFIYFGIIFMLIL